jgi:hypothetical protein
MRKKNRMISSARKTQGRVQEGEKPDKAETSDEMGGHHNKNIGCDPGSAPLSPLSERGFGWWERDGDLPKPRSSLKPLTYSPLDERSRCFDPTYFVTKVHRSSSALFRLQLQAKRWCGAEGYRSFDRLKKQAKS